MKKMETKRLIVSTNYINLHASDRESRARKRNGRMIENVRRETVNRRGTANNSKSPLLFLKTTTTTTSCNNKCRIRETCANENKLYKIPLHFR